jgi:hypothetical protein
MQAVLTGPLHKAREDVMAYDFANRHFRELQWQGPSASAWLKSSTLRRESTHLRPGLHLLNRVDRWRLAIISNMVCEAWKKSHSRRTACRHSPLCDHGLDQPNA